MSGLQLTEFSGGSFIESPLIEIGEGFKIGKNVRIKCKSSFRIGNYCRIGDQVTADANNISIGDHFFHYTPNLRIGGGGSQFKDANLTIGDRCVVHNNYINLARPIEIGNDVGISPDTDLLTHGFWNSMLKGFPYKYAGIKIRDGVIIGQRSFIMMGVEIATNVVIGANSTVTKSITTKNSIYAGSPARFIKDIVTPTHEEKELMTEEMMNLYLEYKPTRVKITLDYPYVQINKAIINLEEETIEGQEDTDTDKLRDWLRRYGIKIYTSRGFKSL